MYEGEELVSAVFNFSTLVMNLLATLNSIWRKPWCKRCITHRDDVQSRDRTRTSQGRELILVAMAVRFV